MHKTAVPTLRIKRTGRDPNTGTSRYTIMLGTFRGTGLTAAEAAELRLMKYAVTILDKAHKRGLFYHTEKPVFTACDLQGQYLAGRVGI